MRATLTIPAARLRQFQELVKQYNLRFCGNPLVMGDHAHVVISSEHLPAGASNPFFSDWDRLQTPITEKTSGWWRRQWRSCVGRLRNIGA